jgi:hypothetical protein
LHNVQKLLVAIVQMSATALDELAHERHEKETIVEANKALVDWFRNQRGRLKEWLEHHDYCSARKQKANIWPEDPLCDCGLTKALRGW